MTRGQRREIFVFGSNLAGRHGKGAALDAVTLFGARYGKGVGLHGDSYAIPTKDEDLNILPLDQIFWSVVAFILFAKDHPKLWFRVTNIGCGLAGYSPEEIAPMFQGAPENCEFSPEFEQVLEAIG